MRESILQWDSIDTHQKIDINCLGSEIADAADSERQGQGGLQHQAYYSTEAIYVAFGVSPSLDGARELKVHEPEHKGMWRAGIQVTVALEKLKRTNRA